MILPAGPAARRRRETAHHAACAAPGLGEHDGGVRKGGEEEAGGFRRSPELGERHLFVLLGPAVVRHWDGGALRSFRYARAGSVAAGFQTSFSNTRKIAADRRWHCAHLIGASVHTGMAKQLMGEEPAANGIGFCLVGIPFAAACFFREQIRVHYNIGGHAICDGCCAVLCLQCTLCQIYRQLKAKPVMRSKLSSDFSSHLYEFYQVQPPQAPGVANPAAGTPRRPSARRTREEGWPPHNPPSPIQ